jgi:hypothetical protein
LWDLGINNYDSIKSETLVETKNKLQFFLRICLPKQITSQLLLCFAKWPL